MKHAILLDLTEQDTMHLVTVMAVLMGVVLVAAVVFYFINKRLKSLEHGEEGTDFSLDDLRQLKAAGHMTEEEHKAAKAKVVARTLEAEARKREAAERVRAARSDEGEVL